MIAVVAGYPAVDRLYEVETLRPGAIHRPTLRLALAGGHGLNAARAVHNLGERPHVVAIVGDRAGQWIDESFDADGINTSSIWDAHETPTAASVVDLSRPGANLIEFYESSPPVASKICERLEAGANETCPLRPRPSPRRSA